MALTEETYLNEILIRFNETGQLQGALLRTCTFIKRDGVIITSQVNDPQQLATADDQTGTTLDSVLGNTLTQALNATDLLTEQAGLLGGQVSDLQADLATATNALADSQASLNAANLTIAELQAKLEVLQSEES